MNNEFQKHRPLLRWAGGKFWMMDKILELVPKEFSDFYEPFVGGGSVFLNIERNNKSFISDSNSELVVFYKQVQENLKTLLEVIALFKNEEKFYYEMRRNFDRKTQLYRAARFYYQNRTCFNGIYRVNQQGNFNVPFGFRDIGLIDEDAFYKLKKSLRKVAVTCQDFESALMNVKRNDLVFLDPPYTVAHNKNGFIEYNQKIFSWEDQERLAGCVDTIIKKKAWFILTNANHSSIKKLYKNVGTHFEIERYSTVSSNPDSRNKISEILITNCV